MKKIHYIVLIMVCFFLAGNVLALEQNEKLWLGLNAQQTLSKDRKWISFIFSQLRFINQSHPWQVALVEGGIGYRLYDDNTIWMGYRFSGHHPNNGFYQENRLFQQYIFIKKPDALYKIISRSRLEETERGNQNQISIRFRQRLAAERLKSLFSSRLFPFVYEEVFFQLNHTNYTAKPFFSENRLFLGFNLYRGEGTWWEIGYINQYLMKTKLQTQNQMNHVLSITYNFA